MNPLTSVKGTIIAGFVLAAIIVFAGGMTGFGALNLEVWFHVLAGVFGLVYFTTSTSYKFLVLVLL